MAQFKTHLIKHGVALGLMLSSSLGLGSTMYQKGIQEPSWGIKGKYNFLVKVKQNHIEKEYQLLDAKEYTQHIPLGDTQCKLLLAGEEDYNITTGDFVGNNNFMLICKNFTTNKNISMLGSFEKETSLSINQVSISIELLN